MFQAMRLTKMIAARLPVRHTSTVALVHPQTSVEKPMESTTTELGQSAAQKATGATPRISLLIPPPQQGKPLSTMTKSRLAP